MTLPTDMFTEAELHLAYRVANAPINPFPYPHFYVQDIFPPDFYRKLQAMLPDPQAMLPIAQVRPVKGYNERFVMEFGGPQHAGLPEAKRAFWSDFYAMLTAGRFGNVVLGKFGPFVEQRFGRDPNLELYDEALLVQDVTDYRLGPHSDAPHKVITLLFYLPGDDTQRHLGTSMYVPKDPNFRCPGGPHYKHASFDRVWTMPFLPNSLFAFVKSDVSFHGVEPVQDAGCRRWLLLYDMYARVREPANVGDTVAAAPSVKFSF